jgi:hypothetical protein
MKKYFLLSIVLITSLANAQRKDFGIWYNVSARYEVIKNLRIEVSEELRTVSNASETDQFFTEVGLNYKLNDYINFGGYYRYIKKRDNDKDFNSRDRFFGEIEFNLPFKRFELSYRNRFQRQINKDADDVEEKAPILYNRHKVSLNYNIRKVKLTPSVFYERFYRLKYIDSYFYDNVRYGINLNYRFNKKHLASAGFLIDNDLFPTKKQRNILSLSYRYTFR